MFCALSVDEKEKVLKGLKKGKESSKLGDIQGFSCNPMGHIDGGLYYYSSLLTRFSVEDIKEIVKELIEDREEIEESGKN